MDTDHVSLFQRSYPSVVSHVNATDPLALAITMITVEEQLRGWLNEIRRASGSRLVQAYSRMHAALDYFHTIQLLDFGDGAHERCLQLREQRIRIGIQDLRIAAIVLSVDGILVTRNQRDFSQVSVLTIVDWTV